MANHKLEKLMLKKEEMLLGGGHSAIERQHNLGKLTARQRIESLLDENSFVELDTLVTHRCEQFSMADNKVAGDGVVTGYGTIEGRLVYVYSQDFTVMGGSLGNARSEELV